MDGDGVLLDYNCAYPLAWARAFGESLSLVDEHAYSPIDRWGVPRLTGEKLDRFKSILDDQFWATIPVIPGALDACERLVNAGFELVCVTALAPKFQDARRRNLLGLGFPIQKVIATGSVPVGNISPKAQTIEALQAVAFVDDYLPYHQGIHSSAHLALITRETNGSPNTGIGLEAVDSSHTNLATFASFWLD